MLVSFTKWEFKCFLRQNTKKVKHILDVDLLITINDGLKPPPTIQVQPILDYEDDEYYFFLLKDQTFLTKGKTSQDLELTLSIS